MNRNKIAILSLSLFGVIAMDAVAPLLKQINASFPDIDATIIKQTVTIPSFIAIFFSLISGQIVRWIPKKGILFIALMLYSIGGVGAGWVDSFKYHLILRGIMGAGMGLLAPITTSLITDFYHGDERADMLGYSMAVSKFAAIIVPPLSVMLAVNNWRNAFNIFLITPLILIFVMVFLDIPAKQDVEKSHEKNGVIPGIVYLYMAFAFLLLCVFFLLVTDLSYLIDVKKTVSSYVSSFGLSTSTIGTTLAGIFFSRIYKKIQEKTSLIGLFFCGMGFFLFTFSERIFVIFGGLFLAGFGFGLLMSTISLLTNNAVGNADSTTANSLINCGVSLGIFISPFMYARISSLFINLTSIRSSFYLASILFLLADVMFVLVILKNKKMRVN